MLVAALLLLLLLLLEQFVKAYYQEALPVGSMAVYSEPPGNQYNVEEHTSVATQQDFTQVRNARNSQSGCCIGTQLMYMVDDYEDLSLALMLAGCYADLDFESLKPLDSLLEELPIALAQMGDRVADAQPEVVQNSIPNAFLCSTPGHRFWVGLLSCKHAGIQFS